MGNLCSKRRKNSEPGSVVSGEEGTTKTSQQATESQENHASESAKNKRENGGATSQSQDPAASASKSDIGGSGAGDPAPGTSAKKRTVPATSFSDVASPTSVDVPLPFELPLEMQKQSDNIQNLMLGRVAKIKPATKGRKITIYLCAAVSQDFLLEKNTFHDEVFKSLRERCNRQGYELHLTDLHWPTDLERQRDNQFSELCLGELQRQLEISYVVPVLFLSSSLGESLLPKTVEQQDFELTLKSVTNVESKSLLENWYGLDTHAEPPCYRLQPISARLPKILSTSEKERSEAVSEWRGIVEQILGIMLQVFSTELRDTYITTVIEQEIHNSILMSREVAKRSVWINRVFTHRTIDSSIQPTPDEAEMSRKLESLHTELKTQLDNNHILRLQVKWAEGGLSKDNSEHISYLQNLSTQVLSQLESIVAEIIEEDKSKEVWKPSYGIDGNLCSELMQHSIFCQQSAKCSISLENMLNTIKQYIESDKRYPLVVHGEMGCGKTCIIARTVQQCLTWFPNALTAYRFVGITPESKTLVQILRTIVFQLANLIIGKSFWIPHTVDDYRRELFHLAQKYSTKSSLVIIIDGLDELDPLSIDELSWLLEELPLPMKLIFSCSEETEVFQFLKSKLKHENAFIPVTNPNPAAAESLLTATLLQHCHSANAELKSRIVSKFAKCTSPMFIKILGWQASFDTDSVGDLSNIENPSSAINNLLDYLEKSLGKDKVETALSLLCAARYGLCDSELLELLKKSSVFGNCELSASNIFLAQLCQKLGPFLQWTVTGGLVGILWRDQVFHNVAANRYLVKAGLEKKTRQSLVEYFKSHTKEDSANAMDSLGNSNQRRKVDEIPFQEIKLGNSIRDKYICNLDWLEEKLNASTVYNVIEDILLECKGNKSALDADVTLLLNLLEYSAPSLNYDSGQLCGQVYGRLQEAFESDPSRAKKTPFVKQLFDRCRNPKLPSFIPVTPGILFSPLEPERNNEKKGYFEAVLEGQVYFDQIARLKAGNQFIVSLSTSNEEVIVWSVRDVKPVRTLRGVQNPIDLKIIDETRVVILCGRELQIYNLDDGSFVSKLKGVMNQKMPYFGLHDDNHIVALSRNRMYINLMNMSSGELISTFKVGEDRFLNSLIVSENGNMLVCGDEVQKPFPLLVWDLTSKKLVYDLRIPHHEFLTNLAAITKEGHFVCCVCRELDDPSPNFIVVYDLQSGTLFKKWKPGCNTVAIAISAQGGCVINALDDNRILVWDLVTGACKYTLVKHTAPVDLLRLDQVGARFLSSDSTGRDRSVCLWDLNTGSLLALFTPDMFFSACEVANDGLGVVFGFKDRKEVSFIQYRSETSDKDEIPKESFGSQENIGKIIDLKSST